MRAGASSMPPRAKSKRQKKREALASIEAGGGWRDHVPVDADEADILNGENVAKCYWHPDGRRMLYLPFVPRSLKGGNSYRLAPGGRGLTLRDDARQEILWIRKLARVSRGAGLTGIAPEREVLEAQSRQRWRVFWKVYRKAPSSRNVKHADGMNPRRGDPAAAHHLTLDALQSEPQSWVLEDEKKSEPAGIMFWHDDSLVCAGAFEEKTMARGDGFLLLAQPMETEKPRTLFE